MLSLLFPRGFLSAFLNAGLARTDARLSEKPFERHGSGASPGTEQGCALGAGQDGREQRPELQRRPRGRVLRRCRFKGGRAGARPGPAPAQRRRQQQQVRAGRELRPGRAASLAAPLARLGAARAAEACGRFAGRAVRAARRPRQLRSARGTGGVWGGLASPEGMARGGWALDGSCLKKKKIHRNWGLV